MKNILKFPAAMGSLLVIAHVCSCSDCSGSLDNVAEVKGPALTFESLALAIDSSAFSKTAAQLLPLSGEADRSVVCSDQIGLSVPDLEKKVIQTRSRGDHELTFCSAKGDAVSGDVSPFEIRGDFIDDALVRLSARFTAFAFEPLVQRMKDRFGPGGTIALSEQLITAQRPVEYLFWLSKGEIWLLSKGGVDTSVLVHQDIDASLQLAEPVQASERGKPVSLEDLGIGALDLEAPLPEIELPDSGTGPSTVVLETQ